MNKKIQPMIQLMVMDWVNKHRTEDGYLSEADVIAELLRLEIEVAELSILCEKMDTELGKWLRGEIVEGNYTADKKRQIDKEGWK